MPIQTVEDPKPQPRLAIYTRPIRKATADRLKMTPTGQMEVIFAVPGGGGDKIGLQPGDVVIRINGRDVPNDKDASAALKELKTGERLELIVERIGGSKTLVGRYETFFTPTEDATRSSKLAEQGDAQGRIFSASVTKQVGAWPRTKRRRSAGFARPPIKASIQPRATWGSCSMTG